ncbi:GNAT family N-acetyltransferase [Aestuariimicrobium soli]|uniref:GNAT family N-acetyltransferase n=1 Tax=Aestuariimicrobium soli TaxID=2035834 RepID=UPI003EB95C78
MSKRVATVTPADLPDVPTCAGEHPDVVTDDVAWPRLAMDHLGLCGVSAHQNGVVVAYALVAPSFAVPDGHPLASPPRTADAAALLTLWVDESYARVGWGRQLMQALAARLVGQVQVIEAAASDHGSTCCEPSSDLLEGIGFVPTELPGRYRLHLDRTVAAEGLLPGAVARAAARMAAWVQQPRPASQGRRENHPQPGLAGPRLVRSRLPRTGVVSFRGGR